MFARQIEPGQGVWPAPPAPPAQNPSGLAPISAPTSASQLASAAPTKIGKPMKIAFIGTALAAIVASAIILTQQGASASPGDDPDKGEASSGNSPESAAPKKPVASDDKTPEDPPSSETKPKNKNGLPPRPQFSGELLDIDADNAEDIADEVGDWVVIRGKVTKVDDKGAIHFENSSLKGYLLEGSAEPAVGGNAQITGILTSPISLRIETVDDITYKKSYPKIFTIEDEAQIREMNNETITVRGLVQDFTKTESGSSLYLVFHENGPGFRAGISPEKTSSDVDEEWLRQFVGKEILVNGRVTTFENAKDKRGKRLVIRFHRKANIRMAE